jgi:hypothetical protein
LVVVWSARSLLSRRHGIPASAHTESLDAESAARRRLEEFEAQRRRETDFYRLPPANATHGADPYALVRLDAHHEVGVLRGASALVLLDETLHEQQRITLPGSLITAAVSGDRDCWVAGELSHELSHLHFDGRVLTLSGSVNLPRIFGIRALAPGPGGVLYALDVHDGRLLTVQTRTGAVLASRVIGHQPLSLRRVGSFLIVDVLLDHALVVYRLDERGNVMDERARITHDGPIWGFDAALLPSGELAIAATGVEDHPLDRRDGAFGYVDSFAFWYLVPKLGPPQRLWQSNVSELGVVTPKAPALRVDATAVTLVVSGYGSDVSAELVFDAHASASPKARVRAGYPGTSAVLRLGSGALAYADPLFDAWILQAPFGTELERPELRPVEDEHAPRSSADERLGEALFFTTLMAPANSSTGLHSRFSCETCHFEGYVDGRVHYTGRADVYATTKPLRGLFNNRPYFSRALDADLETVSHHEFRVAGQGNGKDPWFDLARSDFPWLEQLGTYQPTLSAESLRRALMAFLMGFSHTENPAVSGRSAFTAAERRGAEQFRNRCARCHAARLESDVPESVVPFETWERAIFSAEGALVWASADYQKTGVTPYVHELGTRVPSLRRLYVKWPHFTNGSADTLLNVLSRARFAETRFFHDHAPADATLRALTPEQVSDMVAFLDLL